MLRFFSQLPPTRRRLVLAAIPFAVVALVLVAFGVRGLLRHQNPLLTPKLGAEAVSGRSLYYNGPARPWLLAFRPELLGPEDRQADSPRVRSFVQAVQNPKLFRQLDRQSRFDTLFLVGDPSTYRPLLEHLLEAGDWTLSYLDHTSLIFHRGTDNLWTEANLASVRARFASASAHDQATFLSGAAVKLIAVRNQTLGKKLAEEATNVDPKLPDAWSALALYYLDRGEWNMATSNADRALALDEEFLPALASKAQALYATKHFKDAFHISEKLIENRPDDPGILFYHAKICHEARAFEEEIKALQKLIALAEENDRPVSGYRVYLGQAYARDGQGPQAIEQYEKALADPELPSDQRTEVRTTVAQIKNRLGAK